MSGSENDKAFDNVKNESGLDVEGGAVKPTTVTTTASKKRKAPAAKDGTSPKKTKSEGKGSGPKKAVPWTAEETNKLFKLVYAPTSPIPWETIAQEFEARDWKSCKNKYESLRKVVDQLFLDSKGS